MKHITLLLLLTISLSVCGQEISLMGEIPSNCTFSECANVLAQKGCSLLNSDKKTGISYFVVESGDMTNCIIKLYTTRNQKVSHMEFFYPECDSWSTLNEIYTDLRERMVLEYGEPIKVSEEFMGDQQPKSDYEKLNEVVNGQCAYSSLFKTKYGAMNLFIGKMKAVVIQVFKY